MITEKKLKEILDRIAYEDGELIVEEKTYQTALRYLPYLAKYLQEIPEIYHVNSNLKFKFGRNKKSQLEVSGNDAELKINYGCFGKTERIVPMAGDLPEEDFAKIINSKMASNSYSLPP